MNKGFIPPLRKHLETWEHEASAQWQAVIRSPRVLRRIGEQINRSLESHQRIKVMFAQSAPASDVPNIDATQMVYLLERVQYQLDALAVRINRIERKITR